MEEVRSEGITIHSNHPHSILKQENPCFQTKRNLDFFFCQNANDSYAQRWIAGIIQDRERWQGK